MIIMGSTVRQRSSEAELGKSGGTGALSLRALSRIKGRVQQVSLYFSRKFMSVLVC